MSDKEYLNEKIKLYRDNNKNRNIHDPRILLRQFGYIYNYQENYRKKNYCYINLHNEIYVSIDKELEMEKKQIFASILLARAMIYQKYEVLENNVLISTLEDLMKDKELYELCKNFAKDLLLRKDNLVTKGRGK